MSDKPTKAKPVFYSCCFEPMKDIAKEHGYNLVLHGSMNRDFDLIAIPWIDEPADDFELIKALDRYLTGINGVEKESKYMYSILPGGRRSYVINLNRGGKWNNYTDQQWYIDISITPLPSKTI